MRKTKKRYRSSIKGPILQEIYRGDSQGDNQISWPQPPARPPLCSAGQIFTLQPAHLLGQVPRWENMKQHVLCLSWGPPHQSRSHTETSMGCPPSSHGIHLATTHQTQDLSSRSHVIHRVCRQDGGICQPDWVKRVKNHPLNFSASFLPTSGPISCARLFAATLSRL